jgi:hypothetical protein
MKSRGPRGGSDLRGGSDRRGGSERRLVMSVRRCDTAAASPSNPAVRAIAEEPQEIATRVTASREVRMSIMRISFVALFALAAAASLDCSRPANADTTASPAPAALPGTRVPVLVSLFTSEGCSSCPSADNLLASMTRAPRSDNADIVLLAFHVDYWNYLGWSDPFSTAKNSGLQQSTARALGTRVYTPQAVIDGRVDATGSDRSAIEDAIVESAKTAKSEIALSARVDGKNVVVDASSSALTEGRETLVAITQAKASVEVPRGENSGRTLVHTQIVRAFDVARGDAEHHAHVTLQIPNDMPRADARVVAVVLDATTKRVLAATSRSM